MPLQHSLICGLFVTLSIEDSQHNNTASKLNVVFKLFFILNVVMVNVVMLNVVMVNVVVLNVVMLNVVMINVVMLNVTMVSVVALCFWQTPLFICWQSQ
jgi:hypothetical protein